MLKNSLSRRDYVQVGRIFIPYEAATIDRFVSYRTGGSYVVVQKYNKLDFVESNFDNPELDKLCPDWPNSVASELSDILDKKLKYISGEYVAISASGKHVTRDFYEAFDKIR